jgi:hypothetical protein
VAAVLSREGRLDAGFLRVERDAAARAAVFRRATFLTARGFFAPTRFLAAAALRGEAFRPVFRVGFRAAFRAAVLFFATNPPGGSQPGPE